MALLNQFSTEGGEIVDWLESRGAALKPTAAKLYNAVQEGLTTLARALANHQTAKTEEFVDQFMKFAWTSSSPEILATLLSNPAVRGKINDECSIGNVLRRTKLANHDGSYDEAISANAREECVTTIKSYGGIVVPKASKFKAILKEYATHLFPTTEGSLKLISDPLYKTLVEASTRISLNTPDTDGYTALSYFAHFVAKFISTPLLVVSDNSSISTISLDEVKVDPRTPMFGGQLQYSSGAAAAPAPDIKAVALLSQQNEQFNRLKAEFEHMIYRRGAAAGEVKLVSASDIKAINSLLQFSPFLSIPSVITGFVVKNAASGMLVKHEDSDRVMSQLAEFKSDAGKVFSFLTSLTRADAAEIIMGYLASYIANSGLCNHDLVEQAQEETAAKHGALLAEDSLRANLAYLESTAQLQAETLGDDLGFLHGALAE